jgi:serine/threonine protein kinase
MEVVGQGGQGLVYKAVDNNLNRLVALKLLRTEYSEDKEFVRQFESEAHITALINHPNVVRVFSFGADEGHVYLAMELVGKGTMDDLMEKLGRVPEARALQIGIDIARGLKAGHEQGLVHRDVKPGNVLFGEDGSSKIVDFGLAMFLEQEAAESGEIWGTPYYLSPERLHRQQEDFRSDIYSLGATLFHAIAGRPPFEAEDATGVAMKHMNATAVSIQAWAPDVTNATAFVINRTLSKNPAERYGSYDEFIEQLQFARDEALAKKTTGPKQKQPNRVVIEDAGSQKANSLLTIATLAVLIAGVGVGVWVMSKAGKKTDAVIQDYAGLSAFGPEWSAARDLLAGGKSAEAIEAFRKIASDSRGEQKVWATIFQALSHQVSGNSQAASSALAGLNTGSPLGRFYSALAPSISSTGAVTIAAAEGYNRENYESLALLFLAVKAYESGDGEQASNLFRMFTTSSHERAFEFLSEFKKVARSYEDEFTEFSTVALPVKVAKGPRERQNAVAALIEYQKKLRPDSKLIGLVKKTIADSEAAGRTESENRLKSNLAASAKITVSSWNAEKGDRPENVVDGDSESRWSTAVGSEKWIQFDFGEPKTVSRWALRHSPLDLKGKTIHRIRDFTLEQSADGKSWAVIDSVFGNRSDYTDRIVHPFTARFVRIHCTQPAWDPKDSVMRIYEVELGAASDQAAVPYGPKESVAFRFSPDSPFCIQPVGDVSIAGSASFDKKSGRYTIKGAGEDIWAMADSFHIAHQSVEGDFEFVGRVTKIEGPHPWSKAGLMVRAGFWNSATHAMLAAAPAEKAQFLARREMGRETTAVNFDKRKLPLWFKLVRSGPTITGYESADGKAWVKVRQENPAGLGAIVMVGMFVCAHVPNALATAEFDNVSIRKTN